VILDDRQYNSQDVNEKEEENRKQNRYKTGNNHECPKLVNGDVDRRAPVRPPEAGMGFGL